MPTPSEHKALLFLGTVILLGAGVRGAAVLHSEAPQNRAARAALDAQIEAVDSARHRSKSKSKRPRKKKTATHLIEPPQPAAPEIIDLDIATAAQIETLRGIGPSLAARIVADRDSLGPFGNLEQLQRVKGIGKRLSEKIASQVTFSLLPRHPLTENDGTSSPPRSRRKSRRGESHI